MTTKSDLTEIEICVDCLQLLANGEVFNSRGVNIAPALIAQITSIWGEGWDITPACDEECEGWFSWSSCDGCGSTLGGDRHPAVAWHSES